MKTFRRFFAKIRALASGQRNEARLQEEIESHLAAQTAENIRAGMSPAEARRQAVLQFGPVEAVKEDYRDQQTLPFFDNLLQDTRFAIRQLRNNPGFTSTAVLMLALGMSASVSIFAFVAAALIEQLPYRDPARLVGVYEQHAPQCPKCNLSYLDYLDWKRLNKVFSSLEAYNNDGFIVTTPSGAEPSHAARVSDGFFRALGVSPSLGRDFYKGEDRPGASRTVILSHTAWQKRYGGNPNVIGQGATLNGENYVIIGVLPRSFHFAPVEPAEFWATLDAGGNCEKRRSCHNLYGVARLNDGISVQTAQADTALIAKQLEKQYPDSNRGQGASVLPLGDVIVGDIRPILLVLLSGAGLLLMIACVNVASLLLVRSESRRREMAVRSALGASRARLVRQFVTEGVLLAAGGSTLGIAFAVWAMRLLTRLIPEDLMARTPFLKTLTLNTPVSAFAFAIALLAALLFAVTPTLRLSFANMREGLVEGSRGSAGITWRRLGAKLVVLELATAMILLVAAALLGQSLYRLLHVELNFQPDHLATLDVAAPMNAYGKDSQSSALGREIVARISNLPGVKSVGLTSVLPVSFNGNTDWIRFVGRPYDGEHNEVNERGVSSAYFTTIAAKLIRGRFFSEADDATKPHVVIINQALVRKYFPGEDPIGKQIGDTQLTPRSIRQIIGVVDDVREGALDADIWPAEYLPFNQNPDTYYSLVVRTSQVELSILPALASTIRQIDPGIVTTAPNSMRERITNSPAAYMHRSSAWLVGGFAAMALLLGVIGLYGVIAYSVSQRAREIGVRMALGAELKAVYGLILKEAGWLTAIGISAGLLGSLAAATLLRKLLFGIEPWDAETLIAVAAVLAVAALAASYIPARRAASVNPVDALRTE